MAHNSDRFRAGVVVSGRRKLLWAPLLTWAGLYGCVPFGVGAGLLALGVPLKTVVVPFAGVWGVLLLVGFMHSGSWLLRPGRTVCEVSDNCFTIRRRHKLLNEWPVSEIAEVEIGPPFGWLEWLLESLFLPDLLPTITVSGSTRGEPWVHEGPKLLLRTEREISEANDRLNRAMDYA